MPTSIDDDPHEIIKHYSLASAYDPFLQPLFQDQLLQYFSGIPVHFQVTLDLADRSSFQQRVLLACFTIPFGETLTYAGLARLSGFSGAARAVGSVMASNPLPVVVPCHRVVRADGDLGGFSAPGGTDTKQWFLRHEASSVTPNLVCAFTS